MQAPNPSGSQHGTYTGCGHDSVVAWSSGLVPSQVVVSTTRGVQAGPDLCFSGCIVHPDTDNQGRPVACGRACHFHRGHHGRCSGRRCYGKPPPPAPPPDEAVMAKQGDGATLGQRYPGSAERRGSLIQPELGQQFSSHDLGQAWEAAESLPGASRSQDSQGAVQTSSALGSQCRHALGQEATTRVGPEDCLTAHGSNAWWTRAVQ